MNAILLSLPKSLFRALLSDWLSMEDTCNLDSSICNKNYRKRFLNMISSSDNDTILSGLILANGAYVQNALIPIFGTNSLNSTIASKEYVHYQANYLRWLQLRNINIYYLEFHSPQSFHLCEKISSILTNSSIISHLRIIKLKDRNNNISDEILMNIFCNNNKNNNSQNFRFQFLTEVYLYNCYRINDESIEYIANNCKENLLVFHVSGCRNITDVSLLTMVNMCINLRSIFIANCYKITDKSLIKFCSLPRLEEVDLSCCNKITDNSILELTKKCIYLKSLLLKGCNNITDLSIQQVTKTCPKIQLLDLIQCHLITDDSIIGLSMNSYETLSVLYLNGCFKITDNAIIKLINNCKLLQVLDISGIPSLSDYALYAIGSSPFSSINLHTLYMSCCPTITDDGVEKIVRNCLNLSVLDLYGCGKIRKRYNYLSRIG
eukprot:gene5606-7738_t